MGGGGLWCDFHPPVIHLAGVKADRGATLRIRGIGNMHLCIVQSAIGTNTHLPLIGQGCNLRLGEATGYLSTIPSPRERLYVVYTGFIWLHGAPPTKQPQNIHCL